MTRETDPDDQPFGAIEPVSNQRQRRRSARTLRKNSEVGGGVRILTPAEIQAQAQPEFQGPDWTSFKTQLADFLTMEQANEFIQVKAITPEMKRREWEKFRTFHRNRVDNPAAELPEADRVRLGHQLESEIAYFREVLLKQATPLIALQSALDEVTDTTRRFLGLDNKVQMVQSVASKMDQGMTDILVINAIKEMAAHWDLDASCTQDLLRKHVFDKEPTPVMVPAFPRPRPPDANP